MRKRFNTVQCLPAFLAALVLVLANSSHIHLRYCLDGDEAPVSVHYESTDSHPYNVATVENPAEGDNADVEIELSLDTLLAKISKTPTDSFAISSFDTPAITRVSQSSFLLVGREILPDKPTTFLPPPRAPPAIA